MIRRILVPTLAAVALASAKPALAHGPQAHAAKPAKKRAVEQMSFGRAGSSSDA